MPSLRINDVNYNIVPASADADPNAAAPLYDITFSIPSTAAPATIRYVRDGHANIDSTAHDPSAQSPAYSYTFNALTESEIEGSWSVYWVRELGEDPDQDVINIPNSAITSTTDAGGLDPVPSSVDIVLSGAQSPYVVKRTRISNLKLALETFSPAAEYNPVKVYTLPNGARALLLEVNDYVPTEFGGIREDWILYSFLVDGATYPVTPRNRTGRYPVIYHLNSSLVGPVRAVREANNEGFIDTTTGKITEVGIKIELGRPEEQPNATPIVFGYKLKYIDYD